MRGEKVNRQRHKYVPKMMLLDNEFDKLINEFRTNGEQLSETVIKRHLLRINQLILMIGKEKIFHPIVYRKLINFSNKYKVEIDEEFV